MRRLTQNDTLEQLIDGLMAELARQHTPTSMIRIAHPVQDPDGDQIVSARQWRDRALTAEAELEKLKNHRDRRLVKYNRFRNEVRRLNRAIRFEKLLTTSLAERVRKQAK